MVFIRTAGCSVGCPQCDTNYKLMKKMPLEDIVAEVKRSCQVGWVWITGGEPTDWINLDRLRDLLKSENYKVAIATSGVKRIGHYDFISVSPHSSRISQESGDQLNFVPGLNGMTFDCIMDMYRLYRNEFRSFYVTPLDDGANLIDCIRFVKLNRQFRLGIQAHKFWSVE